MSQPRTILEAASRRLAAMLFATVGAVLAMAAATKAGAPILMRLFEGADVQLAVPTQLVVTLSTFASTPVGGTLAAGLAVVVLVALTAWVTGLFRRPMSPVDRAARLTRALGLALGILAFELLVVGLSLAGFMNFLIVLS